jgi:DNA ligase-1
MKRFAALLDRLSYEPSRNNKLRLMTDYFATTEDPERGWALAALTGALSFGHAKPGMIRALISERADPVLFALSQDYVGDLSETVALMWPARDGTASEHHELRLSAIIGALSSLGKAELPAALARWLDALDETGRWALLKLVTAELRIGVSARLAKTAVAALGRKDPQEIELMWSSLQPPYVDLLAWLEGRADKPASSDPAPFRPPMLAQPIDESDLAALDPHDFIGEWKWDGIRVQAVAARDPGGHLVARLYSRNGDDISRSFPDLVAALPAPGVVDGELLIMREGRVQSFNVLQQRLNRKSVAPKLLAQYPAHLRAYDLLVDGEEDLRTLPFIARRSRLEAFVARLDEPRIDLSPLVEFTTWDELAAARADPARAGAGEDAEAVEGIMLKRGDAPYVPGRPKGPWWKWKRDPLVVDAVLMYAQRGHGKRSSYYSDYTFGVWTRGEEGDVLVPVGKAYFGFTDEELLQIDRFVRRNTLQRYGPVREVVHAAGQGLVLEVAFEGLQRSNRHRSGIAMRFPRINRLRWDKLPGQADRLETLEAMLQRIETGRGVAAAKRAS